MRRIAEPNALAHGVGEDRAEECHGAPSDTTTATYDRETAWLGLLPGDRLAGSDIVHEAFNIVSPDRLDPAFGQARERCVARSDHGRR